MNVKTFSFYEFLENFILQLFDGTPLCDTPDDITSIQVCARKLAFLSLAVNSFQAITVITTVAASSRYQIHFTRFIVSSDSIFRKKT